MNYFLAEASGNTFILFDCLDLSNVDGAFLSQVHQCLQKENRDDALILVGAKIKGETLHARMLVLGLDGALGEFCANGSRSCAAYLFSCYPAFKQFSLTTPWGSHPLASHGGDLYSIDLPPVRFLTDTPFVADPKQLTDRGLIYAEILEPHLIVQGDLSDGELFCLGQRLNRQKELFPRGINVNACHLLEDSSLFVKTYERGVQRLTRSCGTGSIACAALYKEREGWTPVKTPGGPLAIYLQETGITLKGPASVSYKDKRGKGG